MVPLHTRQLVIDACIACSMGERNENGKHCREFMTDAFLNNTNHEVVISKDIKKEWYTHGKNIYATTWLSSMQARKRVFHVKENCEDAFLRQEINALSTLPVQIEAMLKDVILLEAAIKTDRSVISMDQKARRLFAGACVCIGYIRDIQWANPCIPEEDAISWLRDGAKHKTEFQLGNYNLLFD